MDNKGGGRMLPRPRQSSSSDVRVGSEKADTTPADRALAEAAARRAARDAEVRDFPPEIGGRGGAEPVRYGDWERKGLASDF